MKEIGEKFECYSKKLYGFLVMKGISYEYTFVHRKTKKRCWVYIMSKELSEALKEWNLGG